MRRERLKRALVRALDELRDDQRIAFVLCKLEERSSGAAAALVGESEPRSGRASFETECTMLETSEVRWFLDAEASEARALVFGLSRWLRDAGGEEVDRVDRYLATDEDTLGIKLRSSGGPAKLEAKVRTHVAGPVHASGAVGCIECWRKWTLVKDARATQAAPSERWVDVRKRRVSAVVAVADGALVPAPDAEVGCQVEATELALGSGGAVRRALTIGFESFGSYALTRLVSVSGRVLAELASPGAIASSPTTEAARFSALSAEASYGYPRWLRERAPASRQ